MGQLLQSPVHLCDTMTNGDPGLLRAKAIWEWSYIIWCNGLQRAQSFGKIYFFARARTIDNLFALIGFTVFRIAHNMQWPSDVELKSD